MGLSAERGFERYHRVLNRVRWSGLRAAQILLGLLMVLLPVQWPVVIAVDETLERRKGAHIWAKDMYHDAVLQARARS